MVFGDHADHLVSESPCIPRQNLRMQMSYCSASHIIPRWWLFPRILVEPLDGGKSPLCVLEGKGKRWPHLPSPRLGTGVLQGPGPSKFCLRTCLNPFGPRLAISRSTRLHWSRCVRARGTSDRSLLHRGLLCRSLLHRGLLCRSLLGRGCSSPNTRPTWAHYWAFSSSVRFLM